MDIQICDHTQRSSRQQVSLTARLHLTHKGQGISATIVGPADVFCNNTTVISCRKPTLCPLVQMVLPTLGVELQTLVLVSRGCCVPVLIVEHGPILPSPLPLQAEKEIAPLVTLRSEGEENAPFKGNLLSDKVSDQKVTRLPLFHYSWVNPDSTGCLNSPRSGILRSRQRCDRLTEPSAEGSCTPRCRALKPGSRRSQSRTSARRRRIRVRLILLVEESQSGADHLIT